MPMVTFSELSVWDSRYLPDFEALMRQLDPSIPASEERIRVTVSDAGSHLFVVRDGERIIGCSFRQPAPPHRNIERSFLS